MNTARPKFGINSYRPIGKGVGEGYRPIVIGGGPTGCIDMSSSSSI